MAQKIAYQFDHSQLTIEFGDIVTSEAQVIVSSDDCDLTMSGGVSAAIRRAGGDDIALDAAKKIPAALDFPLITSFTLLPFPVRMPPKLCQTRCYRKQHNAAWSLLKFSA